MKVTGFYKMEIDEPKISPRIKHSMLSNSVFVFNILRHYFVKNMSNSFHGRIVVKKSKSPTKKTTEIRN